MHVGLGQWRRGVDQVILISSVLGAVPTGKRNGKASGLYRSFL